MYYSVLISTGGNSINKMVIDGRKTEKRHQICTTVCIWLTTVTTMTTTGLHLQCITVLGETEEEKHNGISMCVPKTKPPSEIYGCSDALVPD